MDKAIQPAAQTLAGGIKLLLNGGSSVMESATIPIQWFFTPELIAQRPKQILIIEQNKNEIKNDGGGTYGARYVCQVADRVSFVQFFSSGLHRIIVLALNDNLVPRSYMRKEGSRDYDTCVHVDEIKKVLAGASTGFGSIAQEDVVGVAIHDIEVPEELFAKRRQGRLGDMVWQWSNLWYSIPPRDQCQYRSRFILAFTVKPLLWLLLQLLKIGVVGLIVLLRLGVLFMGYRPVPLFEDVSEHVWKDLYLQTIEFTSHEGGGYRVWLTDKDGFPLKRMPITGIELTIPFLVYWCYKAYSDALGAFFTWETVCFFAGTIAVAVLFSVLIVLRIINYRISDHDAALVKAKKDRDSYAEWLKHLELTRATNKVELKNLPPSYKGGTVQRFRIAYWALKVKVCRPFSK